IVPAAPLASPGPGAAGELPRDPPADAVRGGRVPARLLAPGRDLRSAAPSPRRPLHRGGRAVLRAARAHRLLRILSAAPPPVHGRAAGGMGQPPQVGAAPLAGVLLLHPRDRPRSRGLRPRAQGSRPPRAVVRRTPT